VTSDAYLNSKVGTDSLNFGKHAFTNLSPWNTPDGINGILAWTAVPATDVNDINTVSTPYQLPNSTAYPSYARVSVGNAIASVEGYEAVHYLTQHHDWGLIDTNHDGLITAQELQTFSDNAASMGVPEAGSMASLLGGTATYGPVQAGINNEVFNENPDQPGAQQRRFNYFDYAANGQLEGSVSISEFKMLGHTLLPSPDAYTIVDRQRAAANGFLLAPTTPRNFVGIKSLQPSFLWIPKSTVARYRHITPDQFTVGRGEKGGTYLPVFTLFNPTEAATAAYAAATTPNNQTVGLTRSTTVAGHKITVDYMVNVPAPTPTPTPSPTGSSTTTTTPSASGNGLTASTTGASNGVTTTAAGTSSTGSSTGTTTPSSTNVGSNAKSPTGAAAVIAAVGQGSTGSSSPTVPTSTALGPNTLSSTPASGTGSTAATSATSPPTSSTSSSGSGAPAAGASPAPLAYSSGPITPASNGVAATSAGPAPTIAPAPLAYSSTPTTIAVTPATAQSQAQRTSRYEQAVVKRYLSAHKKKSTLDKWWGDMKKSLGIK
jgi:hypothetical protein